MYPSRHPIGEETDEQRQQPATTAPSPLAARLVTASDADEIGWELELLADDLAGSDTSAAHELFFAEFGE